MEILNSILYKRNTLQIISKIDHIELTEHTALNKETSSSVGPSNPWEAFIDNEYDP